MSNEKNFEDWYEEEFKKEMAIVDPGIIQPELEVLCPEGLSDVIQICIDWYDGLWGEWEKKE